MGPYVLGIGYSANERGNTAVEWGGHQLKFDYADSIGQAVSMLEHKEYICVAICTDAILQVELDTLRAAKSVPIVVVSPAHSESQRYSCVHFCATQYPHTYAPKFPEAANQREMKSHINIPVEAYRPLTIIAVKDLSFCLEHRSIEVAGNKVELTEKEFDILALLIMNQRKVFTYEMIMDSVWREDVSFYSPKAITTHVSNLKRKLKTAPDVSSYIKNVRGVGYKFEVPK